MIESHAGSLFFRSLISSLIAKGCVGIQFRALTLETIYRCGFVGESDRHAAENHLASRDRKIFPDRRVPNGPGFLGAGMQTLFAREQHDIFHEHAKISPLPLLHLAIDRKNKPDGSAEKLPVAHELFETAGAIGAGNTDRRVHCLTDLMPT